MTFDWNAVIGVVAKAPVAGAVKTRMCPPLTGHQASQVASALLADCLAAASATHHPTVCVFTGPPDVVRTTTGPDVPLLPQRGPEFGDRLAAAQADLGGRADRIVLLGADCPTVSGEYLCAALEALDHADVVLGPAVDGGYTLIGTHGPTPHLFQGVEMGTDRVLAQTLARAAASGATTTLLEPRYDLDTVAELLAAQRAGQLDHASRTLRVVTELAPVLAALPGEAGRRRS